jgi:hypothetical protein
MQLQRCKALQISIIAVTFVLAMSILGCSPIQLIAPYDQKIDDSVTQLQQMTAEFLTKIERQGSSNPEDYKNHAKFYDDAKVALSGILVRATAVTNNTLTVQQLEILRQQFQKLEEEHQKIGIQQAAISELESAFNQTFTAILTLEVAKKQPKA